jgi:hypothetical protein
MSSVGITKELDLSKEICRNYDKLAHLLGMQAFECHPYLLQRYLMISQSLVTSDVLHDVLVRSCAGVQFVSLH